MTSTPAPGTHKCPKTTCDQQVPDTNFACPRHWMEVSPTVRRAIIRAYTNTDQYRHAIEDARHELNDNP